ncbi:MAG: HORMA-1 domain-containing protein [Gemmatimonadaceae bacterium]
MSTSSTGTLTRTASITMIDVRHVLWRIASDLRVLRAQHGLITAEREQDVLEDLLLFIYRNYIDQIEFRFVDDATNVCRDGSVRYAISRNWAGNEDDDSGGLRYRDLRGTSFSVVVWYSATWKALSESEKATFRKSLKRPWGPADDVRDGAGAWVTDKTYGSGGLGATRSVFRAY